MSTKPTPEVLTAARRAAARIHAYGIDGPRPIEEIETLLEHGDEIDDALGAVVEESAPEELAAAIHLVALLRRAAMVETVRRVAFDEPADVEAKREALEYLRDSGVEVDQEDVARCEVLAALVAGTHVGALEEILGWPQAWREPGLRAWLAAAGPAQMGAVDEALGREDDDIDRELLEWLGAQASPEAAEVLQRYLAGSSDRQRVKRAKRALHRMRSQGFDVGEPDGAGAEQGSFSLALESSSLDGSRAYLTSVDGRGARLVWVLWRSPSGGSRVLQAVVDDTDGMREAELATVTRNEFREYVDQLRANSTVLLEQVDVEQAIETLAAAALQAESEGNDVPPAYAEWAEQVGVSTEGAAASPSPSIYDMIDVEAARGDEGLIEESMTLLREPHFQSWAMDGPSIAAAAEEIHQAETSTLMISDDQRRERMQDAIREAVRESFDADTRQVYRRRLEVMASMLWNRDQREAARQALAAAVGLTEIEDLFRGHAFARALVHRGVWLVYQDQQREIAAEQQRSGLIKP